jgi:hypothetical protein
MNNNNKNNKDNKNNHRVHFLQHNFEISGSHGVKYEDDSLLGYSAV